MNAADLILIPLKGADKSDLAGLRREICRDHVRSSVKIVEFELPRRDAENPSYREGVDDWHDAIAEAWETHVRAHLDPEAGGCVALLVWGDPSLYDSTLRIAERVGKRLPLRTRVIPGITAIQGLCAAHAIPLNEIGAPVQITTGRQLRDNGWPDGVDTIVVMLDGDCSFQTLSGEGFSIWWGAYVGMPQEILLSGPLEEMTPTIVERRAAARKDHGWIMDIYLIRRGAA
ncbi:precorrin-6A synthase (deacetylating) [Ostreiculturibacter nitratireducens]|uniref:precorrin-6A synthase (deacetylating) n=1 Tax=Ostreiculturibacter nitratireducens TaxID=3075226 RepID=UPI0031B5B4B9